MSKISNITRASNVASTDLILVTGNVGSTETSYSVEWKNCNDYYQQKISVAKDGGNFSTIQSAIDSITDASNSKKYVIEIYPGTYTENIIMSPYISLKGMGGVKGVVTLNASSGDLLTLPTDSPCGFSSLRFYITGTAKAIVLGEGSTSPYMFFDCGIQYIQANGYTDMIHVQSGEIRFIHCDLDYTSTGATSGTNNHRILYLNGTSSYHLHGCHLNATIDDPSDTLTIIEEASTNIDNALVLDTEIHGNGTNATMFNVGSDGTERNIQSSHLHLYGNSASVGTIYKIEDVDAEIHSTSNHIICEDFTTNYYANVGSSATLISHFDDIISLNGSDGDGNKYIAASTFDGHMSMTDYAVQVYDAAGGVDCNTLAGLPILFNTETIKDPMYTHSTTVNPSRIYVTRTGLYKVVYTVTWAAGSNNTDVSCYLYKNGTTEIVPSRSSAGQSRAGVAATNTSNVLVELVKDDYFQVYAARGGSVTTTSNSVANRSWCTVQLIRGNI